MEPERIDGLKVLLVDDEETVREFIRDLLEQRGDSCDAVEDGKTALELLAKNDYDVLISDLMLPGLSGHEIIKRAKEIAPHLAPILFTGVGTRSDTIAAIREGVFEYIEKPITDFPDFFLALDRAADRARLTRERDRLLANLRRQNARLEANLTSLNEAYDKLMRQEKKLEADLRLAQRMQESFLPARFPRVQGLEFFGYYCPCEPLGGDFFDILPFGGARAALFLGDVAGHGVGAAMVTVILRELIHAQRMLHPHSDVFERPAKALAFLNRGLREEMLDPPLHVTMAYAIVDGEKGELTFSCAGHPGPVLVTANAEARALQAPGPALGLEAKPKFPTATQVLAPGDLVLLYSDGVTEASNLTGEELTAKSLIEDLRTAHGWPAYKFGQLIEQLLNSHQQEAYPTDDISFVAVAYTAAPPLDTDTVEFAPPSVKIVHHDTYKKVAPTIRGRIGSGWEDHHLVLRISGKANWELGPAFLFLLRSADARDATTVYLDLGKCEAIDSTMLGLIHRNTSRLILYGASEKLTAQFRELGIWGSLTVADRPPPTPDIIWETISDLEQDEKSRLILDAHESLMEVSPENRARFGSVVAMMRRLLHT